MRGMKQRVLCTTGSILCSELVAVAFLFSLALGCLDADLLIVLLQSGEILTSFRELTFFHSFSDIPVDKRTLGIHQVEFVVDAGEHLSNSCGVTDHAHCSHDFGEIATWHNSRWLVVDTTLEASWRPIYKLNGTF